MAIPPRGNTGSSTYFVSASTWQKKNLLQSDRSAGLLIDIMIAASQQGKFLLHEFVVMRNHFHLLLTPIAPTTLEKSIQLIKGAFSFRAKRELGFSHEIWQASFYDRRVRNAVEYKNFLEYIRQNPVVAGLCASPGEFSFSSASGKFHTDKAPQRLKPHASGARMQG